MLFKVLDRLIALGETEGLAEKIGVLFATGKLTAEEYLKLTKSLDK